MEPELLSARNLRLNPGFGYAPLHVLKVRTNGWFPA